MYVFKGNQLINPQSPPEGENNEPKSAESDPPPPGHQVVGCGCAAFNAHDQHQCRVFGEEGQMLPQGRPKSDAA